jgi:hypothetical protein
MADNALGNQIISPEQVKKMIIDSLNIAHLSVQEQDKIIGDLGAALMERATYALMMNVPEAEFDKIDALSEQEGKEAEMIAIIQKVVPNAQQIVEEAITSGVEEYKVLVNEQVKNRIEKEVAVK